MKKLIFFVLLVLVVFVPGAVVHASEPTVLVIEHTDGIVRSRDVVDAMEAAGWHWSTGWPQDSNWVWPNRRHRVKVTVAEGTTELAHGAFGQLRPNLLSVELPEGLLRIGDRAFYQCLALEYVNIPESVTSIGFRAFGSTPVAWHAPQSMHLDGWFLGFPNGIWWEWEGRYRPGTHGSPGSGGIINRPVRLPRNDTQWYNITG